MCPLCGNPFTDPANQIAGNPFCSYCHVFVNDVLRATPERRLLMAQLTRSLALTMAKPTRAALRQAATWEKAAGIAVPRVR
jgi:hypothetical protein